MTLEQLLSQEVSHSSGQTGMVSYHPDVRIEVLGRMDGGVHVKLHQMGQNGEGQHFVVNGNELKQVWPNG